MKLKFNKEVNFQSSGEIEITQEFEFGGEIMKIEINTLTPELFLELYSSVG